MDYYEELGISRSASPEEIRQGYRTVARLLHPDRCTDWRMRQVAEIQMKRLNGIAAVLLDGEARRRYDATLEMLPARLTFRRRPARAIWIWVAATAIGIAGPAWYFRTSVQAPIAVVPPIQEEPVKQPETTAASESSRETWSKRRRPARRGRQTPGPQKARRTAPQAAGEELEPLVFGEWSQPVTQAPIPRSNGPGLMMPIIILPEDEFTGSGFTGSWFYVKGTAQPKSRGGYAPQYIQLRVTEDRGTIRGRYRARYMVRDKAISPAVSFDFEGDADVAPLSLPWTGGGGAYGEVTISLVSYDVLEVRWRAHKLSNELALVSGSARLLRRRDP